MNPIELRVFISHTQSICEEMGLILKRSAFSPNIKDRLDFSCALFDVQGELFAQAAHIPVHLGSMAYAMRDIVANVDWQDGQMIVVNDPYLGGTHLPDITLIAPCFVQGQLTGFIANRAHHANIGAASPGSMPIATCLEEEGVVIPPTVLVRDGQLDQSVLIHLCEHGNTDSIVGDFLAQMSANLIGVQRLVALIEDLSIISFQSALEYLNTYARQLALHTLKQIPCGQYQFSDVMDDDGVGQTNIPICVTLTVEEQKLKVDFSGTSLQTTGNINCPLSVAAASVFYVFRCLMPAYTPEVAGAFSLIDIDAPPGCLLNAQRPAAVAAGNVETSTRIVDVILGALAKAIPDRIPAASHGSMNNVAMGSYDGVLHWDYYETIGGGMGAGPSGAGLSAVHTHMTNTLNTPIESLEMHYPLRIKRYCIREGSGGEGRHRGGDGIIREYQFLQPTHVSLLTERRTHSPWGLAGGQPGLKGVNLLNNAPLPSKCEFGAQKSDVLTIITAGGGGWGEQLPDKNARL